MRPIPQGIWNYIQDGFLLKTMKVCQSPCPHPLSVISPIARVASPPGRCVNKIPWLMLAAEPHQVDDNDTHVIDEWSSASDEDSRPWTQWTKFS